MTAFTGYLRIIGIVGKISSLLDKVQIWGKLNFEKIHLKSEGINAIQKDYDRKLEIQILPPATALQVRMTEFPKEVIAGEIFEATVEIRNSGKCSISDIYIASNSPKEFIIDYNNTNVMPLSIEKGELNYLKKKYHLDMNLCDSPTDFRNITHETFNKDREARRQFVTKIIDSRDENVKELVPEETRRIKVYVQAPHKKGKKSIKILIYYNVPENYPKIK